MRRSFDRVTAEGSAEMKEQPQSDTSTWVGWTAEKDGSGESKCQVTNTVGRFSECIEASLPHPLTMFPYYLTARPLPCCEMLFSSYTGTMKTMSHVCFSHDHAQLPESHLFATKPIPSTSTSFHYLTSSSLLGAHQVCTGSMLRCHHPLTNRKALPTRTLPPSSLPQP